MPLPIYKNVRETTKIRFIIAIAAGKGGVGKSTLTSQLAYALERKGLSIGVLDSDLYGPSLRKMLPESCPPRQEGELLIPARCGNISVVSLAHFYKPEQAAVIRAPIANKIITQFLQNTLWGQLDLLLIDFPPGTGDIQLTLSQQAKLTAAIAITTPQQLALLDVHKAISLFEQTSVPLLGIVENMSFYSPQGGNSANAPLYPFGQGGGARLANANGVDLLGQIPLDPALCLCGDTGQALWGDPVRAEGATAKVFETIADKLWTSLQTGEIQKRIELSALSVNADNRLTLTWSDGLEQQHSLELLQKACPCAACHSSLNGKPCGDVTALKIAPIGRYALKITFSSGCSDGIYSFDLLRHFNGSR